MTSQRTVEEIREEFAQVTQELQTAGAYVNSFINTTPLGPGNAPHEIPYDAWREAEDGRHRLTDRWLELLEELTEAERRARSRY